MDKNQPEPLQDSTIELFSPFINQFTYVDAMWAAFDQLFTDPPAHILNGSTPELFTIVREAMIDSLVMGTIKFFDEPLVCGRRNLTIRTLLQLPEVKALSNLTDKARQAMAEVESQLRVIRDHRNKSVGHLDFETATGVKNLPNLPYTAFKEVLAAGRNIFNLLSGHFHDRNFAEVDIPQHRGAKVLYQLIEMGIEARRAKINAEHDERVRAWTTEQDGQAMM